MSKRVLILLSEPEAARGLATTLETLGVKSTCHSTVFEAVSDLYSSQMGWIVLSLDLFDRSSRAQLLTPELWTMNLKTPVVLVSKEDPLALRKFFAGGPMQIGGVIAPEDPERLADRVFSLYLETVGQDGGWKPGSGRPGGAAGAKGGASREAARPEEPKRVEKAPAAEKPAPVAAAPVAAAGAASSLSIEEKRRIEAKLQMLDDGDLYRTLEIAQSATDRQVKAAYFRLVKQFHPDRFFGRLDDDWNKHVTRLFRGITRVYETLLDPKSRQRYDGSYQPTVAVPIVEIFVRAAPVEKEPPPPPSPDDEVPLTRGELDELLRREREWLRDRDSQASSRAQALFEQAVEVLANPDPASLPLAPVREAYKLVTEATTLMPGNEEYAEAQERLRVIYERKRAYYHFRRGQERLEAGELPEGYQDLKDAVVFDPRTEYLLMLVQTMLHHGWDLARAEVLSQSLVDEEPENAVYRLLYGRALATQGYLKDGLAHLQLAARLGLKAEAFRWIQHFEKRGADR